MSYFEYYETRADGSPKEDAKHIAYEDRRILFLRWKWSRVDLQHFIDLACAVPGTVVDVTHWENGQLIYSARLTYKLEGDTRYYCAVCHPAPDHMGERCKHYVSTKENAPRGSVARLVEKLKRNTY